MEQKEYNSYVERWKKYWKDEKIYYEEKRKLVIRSDAGENVEKEFKKLDKRFGHGDLFSSKQYGPFTVIKDKADLLNPNFILPGLDCSFYEKKNTDKKIPEYFGKKIVSELDNCIGTVIGYSYDAYDDYIMIELENGAIKNIMVNSHYHLVEE